MSVYKALEFFMLRTPVFTYDKYLEFCKINDYSHEMIEKLLTIAKNKDLLEPIAFASPSLYKSILKLDTQKDPKKINQTVNNFIKYLIRMTTRPTPFGMFSGVDVGTFKDTSSIVLDDHKYFKKHIRPDMEWIMTLISKIEKDTNFLMQLNVRVNSMVDIVGNRVTIPYTPEYGIGENLDGKIKDMTNKSIRFTEPVKLVYDNAKNFIRFSDLLKLIISYYTQYEEKQIQEFLINLFQSEFIISELRPPLMIESPFEYVFDKVIELKGIDEIGDTLEDIRDLIRKYEETSIGEGIEILDNLILKMNKIATLKSQVQVDVTLKTKECFLNKQLTEEGEKVLELLCRMAPPSTPSVSYLNSYRNDFIEKYGVYREVPVLELLDDDRGIGAPATYQYPPSRREYKPDDSINRMTPIEKYVLNKLLQNNSTYEILLDDNIIDSLYPEKTKWEEAPVSSELYFLLSAQSSKDIDNGNYELTIAPNPGSMGAGKTFGRFMYYLDNSIKDNLAKINSYEQQHHPDTIFAELVYIPLYERAANVTISGNVRSHEVALGTNSSKSDEYTLPLSDLMIGATYDNFYVKSKKLNKKVILKTGHMLNLNGAPNIYKFLREVSTDGYKEWIPPYFIHIDSIPFLPRIRYSKTILSPAKWNVTWKNLEIDDESLSKIEFEAFLNKFRTFMNAWHAPKYAFWLESDNRVLLNLENEIHIKIIFDQMVKLKSYASITLIESLKAVNWMYSDNGNYIGEIVVPFVKNIEYRKKQTEDSVETQKSLVKKRLLNDTRAKYPGSDWLYFKLYGHSNREEEFIAYNLNSICNEVIEKSLADKFFFMRYTDDAKHIRLRFNGNPKILCSELLPFLHEKFITLNNDGLLSRYTIDTYEPEVERYGGPELIGYAETIFMYDSVVVFDLINLKRENNLEYDMEKVAVLSVLNYLDDLGMDIKEQLDLLNKQVNYKDYLEDFRKERGFFMRLANPRNNWENLLQDKQGKELFNIFSKRKASVKGYVEQLHTVQQKNEVYNLTKDIYSSIIHLHCNRLIGTNRLQEQKVMTIARHTLTAVEQYNKNNK